VRNAQRGAVGRDSSRAGRGDDLGTIFVIHKKNILQLIKN
jgi:hypothetical protein